MRGGRPSKSEYQRARMLRAFKYIDADSSSAYQLAEKLYDVHCCIHPEDKMDKPPRRTQRDIKRQKGQSSSVQTREDLLKERKTALLHLFQSKLSAMLGHQATVKGQFIWLLAAAQSGYEPRLSATVDEIATESVLNPDSPDSLKYRQFRGSINTLTAKLHAICTDRRFLETGENEYISYVGPLFMYKSHAAVILSIFDDNAEHNIFGIDALFSLDAEDIAIDVSETLSIAICRSRDGKRVQLDEKILEDIGGLLRDRENVESFLRYTAARPDEKRIRFCQEMILDEFYQRMGKP